MCLFFYDGSTPKAQPKVVLQKPGIEPATPGLQGIELIHYTTAVSLPVEPSGAPGHKTTKPKTHHTTKAKYKN